MDFIGAVQLQSGDKLALLICGLPPPPLPQQCADVYTDMNGLICNPGLGVIIPRRHDSVAAAPAGPRALADIRRRDQRVPEPPGPPADRAGEARRGAGQREEVPRGRGWWRWLHGCVTFEPWPLVPPQLSEDADAAAKDKGHTSAVSQRQAYRQYVCLFASMYCVLFTFVLMAKNTTAVFPYVPSRVGVQRWANPQVREVSFCIHVVSVRLTQAVTDFVLNSAVTCLSLRLPRIHLSSHVKRVKSLFREDCTQRYKELLATTRIWSRSVQRLRSYNTPSTSDKLQKQFLEQRFCIERFFSLILHGGVALSDLIWVKRKLRSECVFSKY